VNCEFGPWALIIGGSEGVGAHFARRLAGQGVNLVIAARKPAPLIETATAARALGVEVRTLSLDVTADDAVERLIEGCAGCEIRTLICNAGANHGVAPVLDQPLERSLRMLRLNCETPLRLIHHFGGLMQARGTGGNIILLGSGAGMGGAGGIAVYAAAKAFMHTFAEALWYELRPKNIRVLCLVLGLTDTPAMARAGFHAGGGFTADDPDAVAEAGLAQIGTGPVFVMPSIRGYLDSLRGLPRAELVQTMSRATLALRDA
jgi:uncharacterized protein